MVTFLWGREETVVKNFILKKFCFFLNIFGVRSCKDNMHDKRHRVIKKSAKIKVFCFLISKTFHDLFIVTIGN